MSCSNFSTCRGRAVLTKRIPLVFNSLHSRAFAARRVQLLLSTAIASLLLLRPGFAYGVCHGIAIAAVGCGLCWLRRLRNRKMENSHCRWVGFGSVLF